jgi:putative SbcD/Mre11-related phosphoesterase
MRNSELAALVAGLIVAVLCMPLPLSAADDTFSCLNRFAGPKLAVRNDGAYSDYIVDDYQAGIEVGLGREGVELASQADERLGTVRTLLDRADPDRLIVLGDLGHAIGDPGYTERDEIEALLAAIRDRVPITLVKGNHDGDVEALVSDLGIEIEVTPTHGTRLGDVGFVHGHTWPAPDVLAADVVCVGHEHPEVRLVDEVGGRRLERVWRRGRLNPAPFRDFHGDPDLAVDGELVVFPAFNELSGGTWVNVPEQEFLAPFLPEGLRRGEAYLLDGTRLGPYRDV